MKKILVLILGLCLASSAWGIAPNSISEKTRFQNIIKTPVDIISDRLIDLIGEKYVMGMWFFESKTKGVIEDRGPRKNKVILGTVPPPDKDGLLPCIPFGGTSTTYWRSVTSSDFSFGNNITDKPFTLIIVLKPVISGATQVILGEWDTDAEFLFFFDTANKINMRLYKSDASAWSGRMYNTDISADNGKLSVYIATYSGTGGESGIKIFRKGLRVDDAASTQAGYVAMKGTASRVGNYYSTNYFSGKYSFAAVISRELNEKEVLDVYKILTAASGGSLM